MAFSAARASGGRWVRVGVWFRAGMGARVRVRVRVRVRACRATRSARLFGGGASRS